MFAGMDVIPQPLAPSCRPRAVSSSDSGPRGQHPQKKDHCISILTGLSSSKKKLSKRPGYMKKDVEQRLHRPTHVGVHFVSQHVENERENCTDLSFNNNRLEGYFLNNLKHLSEDKIAEHQNTILNHLGAASPIVAAFQPNMIMSESIRYSDSNCQWTDGCGGSCYTGINTCSKPLPTGCLQKQDAGPTQCEMEKGIDLQSMIQKLKKLQKKAVQEDDYEKADKFSKKLAELKREKSSLKFQLPSYQPCIARFLQEVKLQSQVAEHHNNAGSLLKSTEDKYSDSNPDNQHLSWSRRKQLILDRQQLQEEISDLKERLAILEAQDNQLSIEIEEESRLIHSYDCELNSLSTLSTNELQDLNKILEDVLPLRNKILFTVKLPEDIKRLQKKEQSLSTAIKTATTKVCNSQKLCSNLSKKVSGIEAQLPTLLEAKMLSISGREFSTAKDLAEEIKYLTSEKTRFEEFISELQHLSIKNAQRVEALREEYSSLRTELVQEEGLFENNLKENVFKYMEVLEDKLHSYGSQLLEKVWEADLEACQIYVRGLQLKEGNYHATEREEFQADEYNKAIEDACTEVMVIKDSVFPSKQDWCAKRCSSLHQKETDPSEVSFKCSFSIKDIQSEVAYNRGSAVDIEEECEMIRDRLLCLEGQLQMAIYNHDNSFSQYLQREIQMVKETLQAMLKQLLPLEKEEKEELGNFVINSW
ncbi:disrupted in schizophrenia 1 protein isoform X7 [Scyliorhinus canicula]|uniref:disrupted in schizophrenia 1 protein isoform X7 n=1 Tax=Scyliorhinus canicula TaxID=7830 RepID=UPI0018F4A15A|nr:disrupted in schizophrenia 1 protein isoform X7 [Scyliorhinus canicula]